MLTPLYVAVFASICAVGAYGIHKRAKWAWYMGWVFMFFTAGPIGLAFTYTLFCEPEWLTLIPSVIGLFGAVFLWTGWAIWWSRRQNDFGVKHDEPA